jgi:putative peptide zinc metalloprotease protein
MHGLATALPARRPELLIRALGERGQYVAKDQKTDQYFNFGEQEHFLLMQLDGQRTREDVRAAFERRFGEALSDNDLQEFIKLAARRGLVRPQRTGDELDSPDAADVPRFARRRSGNSLLYWRTRLFDPDRFCNCLEPKIRYFWTPAFLLLSAAAIALAVTLVWANGRELVTHFAGALRWETFVLVWLTLFVVTMLHEFAHGLTCKHYGGEVHEIGFLLMFFMPCFYCNVSDAWLFPEKSKRLWVTFAGGYFELFIWALAVFLWRLTMPDSLVNYLAFVVLSVCGIQTLFNFNPLLKLDGYYLLSDWLEIPNLRQQALDRFKGQVRRLLWGAARPAAARRARLLLGLGSIMWLYSVVFFALMLWALGSFFGAKWGWFGVGAVAILGLVGGRGLVQGITKGEVGNMIRSRRLRSAAWLLILAGGAVILTTVDIEDRVGGAFQLRSKTRHEIRAPLAGFLQTVHCDEGDRVSPGAPVVQLDVPDLASRIAEKQAEIAEARAKLRLLEAGTRKEEIEQQRHRVERMTDWRDLAEQDLAHARKALEQELARLDQQIAQYRAEVAAAADAFLRAQKLARNVVVSEEQLHEAERRLVVAQTLLAQAESQKRHRQALGTREAIAGLDAEAELAHRKRDLADAQATLTLMEAGTRPEEMDAVQAVLARLTEQLHYLQERQDKLAVSSPVSGVIVTPRLKEMVGKYVNEGDLIGVVEEPSALEMEIIVPEQDAAHIKSGQRVEVKARALPFETFMTTVDRIAPAAKSADSQSQVTLYCNLDRLPIELRPEMSGYARIYTGRRSLGEVLFSRFVRFLRTEFWW